jgi:hypothetical protein
MPINPPAPKSRTADLSRSAGRNANTLWFMFGIIFGLVIDVVLDLLPR